MRGRKICGEGGEIGKEARLEKGLGMDLLRMVVLNRTKWTIHIVKVPRKAKG